MKRIMLALLASLTIAAAPAERRYTVTDFDRVRIDGPFEVELVSGRAAAAAAEAANAAALDPVLVDVEARTLRIRMRPVALGSDRRSNRPVRLRLATHDLRSLSVNGAARVRVDGLAAQKVDLLLSGSGAIDARGVEADVLNLGLLGSGRIAVAGSAKTLNATVQGSGDLQATGLAVDQAELNAENAGEVALQVRTLATVRANGTGGVTITGPAACEIAGSGSVSCESD